jgi:serine/threonine protein kinase
MSPETTKKIPSTTKVDMWAIGIILYQLLSKGNHPFIRDKDVRKLISAIKDD